MINIILIIAILVFIGYAVYWYFSKADAVMQNDDGEIDFENLVIEDVVSLKLMVKESISLILRENLKEQNLSKKEYKIKNKNKAKLRLALKESSSGNPNAKKIVKNNIRDIITTNSKIQMDSVKINKFIPFDDIEHLSSQYKFMILVYIYSAILGYSRKGLEIMFLEYGLNKPIIDNQGNERYVVTNERINAVYEDVIKNKKITLTYNDKLEILTQRVFELYKGLGAADILFETTVDEIDGGPSGIPMGSFELVGDAFKHAKRSFESIWIVFKGINIHLECLSFGSQKELIRVCQNIYKFDAPTVLSKRKGYIVSTMKDGSRITVARPPFSSTYAFWARKFDSAPSLLPDELIRQEGADIIITLIKWLIKGQRNVAITGQQATGKSTFLKMVVSFIDNTFNIRIQELAAELNLNFSYPWKNIVAFQETESISAQEGLNFQKKTNGAVNIIGEIASAIQASHLIQTAMVASLFALFTHHAKTTYDLILAIANNLLELGLYKEKKEAIEMSAKVLNIDVHLVNVKGDRHVERINEVIPITDTDYPSDKDQSLDINSDTKEYYKRQTDRPQFTVNTLAEYVNGHFVLVNGMSKEMEADIRNRLSVAEEAEFDSDMARIKALSDAIKLKYSA